MKKRHKEPQKPRLYLAAVMVALAATAVVLAFTNVLDPVLLRMQVIRVGLPSLAELNSGVSIYDRNDHYVCTLRPDGDRKAIPLACTSKGAITAVMASEDHRFMEHPGVDPLAVARAFQANFSAGKIVEGGSTITQQLVKNLYLDPKDKSYGRKLREALMALYVESTHSKKKILETYLNVAYFGQGAFGIERAAQHYFNKPASDLTLAEGAYLAGLLKSPSVLSQKDHRAQAIQEQRNILNAAQQYGLARPDEVHQALAEKLNVRDVPIHNMKPWPYYMDCVLADLKKELGDRLWERNWHVYTYFDPGAQTIAQKALNQGIAVAPRGIDQGALVSMSIKDGGVLAIVGGVGDYQRSQWNRAMNPHTAGSAFKPFVYLAALVHGVIGPESMIQDAPLRIAGPHQKTYEPRNYDGSYKGWMPARLALAQSRNVCAIRVAQSVGIDRVIEAAHLAGIKSQLPPYISLALGSCAVTPLEMATSYATFARGGVYMPPQILRRIETDKGLVYSTFNSTPSANLPSEPSLKLLDCLTDAVRLGTGRRAYLNNVQVAGKTGTANDSKDLWFIGLTPEVVTAVWGGNDRNKPVAGHGVTGGAVIAGIWKQYMLGFLKEHKPQTLAFFTPAATGKTSKVQQYAPELVTNPADSSQEATTNPADSSPQTNPQATYNPADSGRWTYPDFEKAVLLNKTSQAPSHRASEPESREESGLNRFQQSEGDNPEAAGGRRAVAGESTKASEDVGPGPNAADPSEGSTAAEQTTSDTTTEDEPEMTRPDARSTIKEYNW